jgi:predicted transcriptional regulator
MMMVIFLEFSTSRNVFMKLWKRYPSPTHGSAKFQLERAFASSKKLYDALEGVQSEWGAAASQPQQMLQYLSDLRQKMAGPDLSTILETTPPPVLVNVRTTVREAAGLMKNNHTTAVLVMDHERIAGIFTSKDVVLRVIAPGYDPSNTSVVRVMTPHPDTAKEDLSIQAALRKMHGSILICLCLTF